MQEISLKNSVPAIFLAVLNFDICKLFVCNVKVRFLLEKLHSKEKMVLSI